MTQREALGIIELLKLSGGECDARSRGKVREALAIAEGVMRNHLARMDRVAAKRRAREAAK